MVNKHLKYYADRLEGISNIPFDELISKGRRREFMYPKHAIAYLLCRHFTTTEVGELLGIDHSTVIHRRDVIRDWLTFGFHCFERSFARKINKIDEPNFENSDPEELFYSEICLP